MVSLAAELTWCLGAAFTGMLRLRLIFPTTSLTGSCIIEGASGQTGISFRWTRVQAHIAAVEDSEELSCYYCMIEIPGSY